VLPMLLCSSSSGLHVLLSLGSEIEKASRGRRTGHSASEMLQRAFLLISEYQGTERVGECRV
jgi:hypothetical protein